MPLISALRRQRQVDLSLLVPGQPRLQRENKQNTKQKRLLKLEAVFYVFNPNTQEAQAGRSLWVGGQVGLNS